MRMYGKLLLAGPLQGRVVPSMCMWALLPAIEDYDNSLDSQGTVRLKHHKIQLSLEKGWCFPIQHYLLLILIFEKHLATRIYGLQRFKESI